MKCRRHRHLNRPGFTLVEMSLVLGLLIALMGMGTLASFRIADWKAGRQASETLRSVYVAQRTYLADHPTTAIGNLSQSKLLPYIPQSPATFPTVEGLDGTLRQIRVTVSPPVVIDTSGTVYDPSGNSKDSLWDVGE
jgi:type II secretory pathway pseudopilin PulG